MLLYPIGTTAACTVACDILKNSNFTLTDHPHPEITHVLLDVPAFSPDGYLRSGASAETIFSMLPPTVHVIGGNLGAACLDGYTKTDLLRDPYYLARNAEITADCALRLAGKQMDRTFSDTHALVIGWGRIGKCLAQKLSAIGCKVTIAARKEQDRAMLLALGYNSVAIEDLPASVNKHHVLFNTVPAALPELKLPSNILAYELASSPGLTSDQAIIARGLPGTMAPDSSGALIAERIIRLYQEESL